MKKSLVYIIAPIVGMIIFGAIYWNFSSTYDQKVAAEALRAKQKREADALQKAKDNEKAILEANAGVARRKAERDAKEAKDKKDHEERQAAVDARDKANSDRTKFNNQVLRLEADLKSEKEAVAKLEEDKRRLTDEQAFLKVYVKQADENVKSLKAVLDKIAAADAARAAAEAAAAAAKKKENS